jgi:uncharacterized membrane protein YfcA
MKTIMITFPVSGVETYWWLPALAAFVVSFFMSTGGISGAFILLPFQVTALGFTSPAVSPTNLLYNIIAIPGGVYRFIREQRMLWPLAVVIMIGTAPGLLIGAYLRVQYLTDPKDFKLFVGLVLLYIFIRLINDIISKNDVNGNHHRKDETFVIKSVSFDFRKITYEFDNQLYNISTLWVFALTFIVGIIGGAYGIGGGAIVAPFLVAVFRLPVYTVAGPALFGTFFTSIAGIYVYSHLLPILYPSQAPVYPDWLLGLSMGIGGFAGIYLGARLQRYLPARIIKLIIATALLVVIGKYVIGYFI